ncbi:MAG: 2,4-dihydroxyhept-2-ene-1,7-dioic acid aldolase [Syntrophomonadaceae bacterium]|nr:2,4-dihydroxyhept-2-ene-1,7-dioic acid aldolase [Syntrophomonadaceae bacterium]
MIDLKDRLLRDEFSLGSWITLGHTSIAEIMAKSGFDWLTIDMEHSVIELNQAQEMIRTIEMNGSVPLVRVGDNDPYLIKRVMDAGSHGVIVPMVNSRQDAERAVGAVQYPPKGFRGVGLARAQQYGFGFEEYKSWLADNSVAIVQIEHIKAIERLEEILSTPGVDGSIIGPYDLSGSLGYPGEFNRPEVLDALQQYEKVSKRLKKAMGFHVVQPDPELTNSYKDKGYTFIAVGLDTLYLGGKCRETIAKSR